MLKRLAQTVPYARRLYDGLQSMRAHITALKQRVEALQASAAASPVVVPKRAPGFEAIHFVAAMTKRGGTVLEHLAAPWRCATEINRALRIGGETLQMTHQTWPLHETQRFLPHVGPGAALPVRLWHWI